MNSKEPFFTVGVPVYNVEKYLRRNIESILSQDFDDFELILVNDGSTDSSPWICDEYRAKDSRIRVINKENGGLPAARNTFFYYAKGKYIFSIDSDDEMCENVLQRAYDWIVKSDYPDILDTGFIRDNMGVQTVVETVPTDKGAYVYSPSDMSKDEKWFSFLVDKHPMENFCAKFIKRDFLQRSGLSFQTRLTSQEDNDFTFEICRKADTIAFADFCSFIYYKSRPGSLSTSWPYKSVYGVFSRLWNLFNDMEFYKISDETRAGLLQRKRDTLYMIRRNTLSIAALRPKEECFKLIDMTEKFFGKDIRKLPVDSKDGRASFVIFTMYKLFGLRAAYKMLYSYLELKGRTYEKLKK